MEEEIGEGCRTRLQVYVRIQWFKYEHGLGRGYISPCTADTASHKEIVGNERLNDAK